MLLIRFGNSTRSELKHSNRGKGKKKKGERATALPPRSEPVGGLCRIFAQGPFCVVFAGENKNCWDESPCTAISNE